MIDLVIILILIIKLYDLSGRDVGIELAKSIMQVTIIILIGQVVSVIADI